MGYAARIILPPPHEAQEKLCHWDELYPKAQALIAPCGTKVGKSFGSSWWLAKEALLTPGLFCVWIAPTYKKCRIGYRYIKAMVDIPGVAECIDGKLEIRFANGSTINFLHGRDAEVTVEGEAIDRFVLDEAAKLSKQVWFSLITTITQTGGYGIVTGTPRGFNWYYDAFKKAKEGDEFLAWAQLRTEDSPYIKQSAIDRARRILPPALFGQYYEARFVSAGDVFGDLSGIWDESIVLPPKTRFWVHPDVALRSEEVFHGVDVAKKRDFTVFFSVNHFGKVVGYARFKNVPYPQQATRFEQYINRFFGSADNVVKLDSTGVGEALYDHFIEKDIDATIDPVVFTNKIKQDLVTRMSLAIEQRWLSCPRFEQFEHEMAAYEVSVTKTGLHSYNATEGEHDDTVCAAMLAVSAAFRYAQVSGAESLLTAGHGDEDDDILEYVNSSSLENDDDDFFDNDGEGDEDDDFDFTGTYG